METLIKAITIIMAIILGLVIHAIPVLFAIWIVKMIWG